MVFGRSVVDRLRLTLVWRRYLLRLKSLTIRLTAKEVGAVPDTQDVSGRRGDSRARHRPFFIAFFVPTFTKIDASLLR